MSATIRTIQIPLGAHVFDVDVAGEPGQPLVLLLHGFPQTSYAYRHALPALADAGYFAAAPNQRGYSPGARPPRIEDYATRYLTEDALAIATAFGAERFHLVGHDWGGQLAWLIGAAEPERVRSLAVLSRPHPAAFVAALKEDAAQSERSRHHRAFSDPDMASKLLADDAKRLRRTLADQGVARADIDAYLSKLDEPAALDAALNWYRAAQSGGKGLAVPLPPVRVPTLYIWGDADATVGRAAAEGTAQHVTGSYQFEILQGVGHFLTDQAEAQVTELLLQHIRK
ncbi:MAG TPA: alpha/beta hydrolase [Polyangiales bacterium]|jgi:pimeloyl-ACP methyl ester carboxylesterase